MRKRDLLLGEIYFRSSYIAAFVAPANPTSAAAQQGYCSSSMAFTVSYHPRHHSRGQDLFSSSSQQPEDDDEWSWSPSAFGEPPDDENDNDNNDDELSIAIDQAILDTTKQFAARKAGSEDGDKDKRHRQSKRNRKDSAHQQHQHQHHREHSVRRTVSSSSSSNKNKGSGRSKNDNNMSRGPSSENAVHRQSRSSGGDRNNNRRSNSSETTSSRPKPTRSRSRGSLLESEPSRSRSSYLTSSSTSHAAERRREAARSRGTETLTKKQQQAEADALYGSSPRAAAGKSSSQKKTVSERHTSGGSRDVSITPSRRRHTVNMDHSLSRTRSSQRAEKRHQWKEAKAGGGGSKKRNSGQTKRGEASSFDDLLDEKVQRRQSMLETSKRGIIRASASRTRGRKKGDDASDFDAFDDDEDDNYSVSSSYSYLTAQSDLSDICLTPEMQRRQSCSYLPSGLSGSSSEPNNGRGAGRRSSRRPSAFGSSAERQKAISIVATGGGGNHGDNDDDSEDDESVASNYIPTGLSRNCNYDVDRADYNSTSRSASARRGSMSASQLTVPIVDTPNAADANSAGGGSLRELMSRQNSGLGGSSRNLRRASTVGTMTMPAVDGAAAAHPKKSTRRASTMGSSSGEGAAPSSSKHDKGIEEILKNRRLRGDSSLARNRYVQDEGKEEEQRRMVEPLKMLSTVGTAGIKGLTTVTNAGIQGVSAVGNAGLNVSKQTVNASIKGISTVGNAGLNVSKQTVNASMKGISTVGNAGLNVTKQTAKGISTVSRKGVKGGSSQRLYDAAPVDLDY